MTIKQFTILSKEDVQSFFRYAEKDLQLNFHPDDPFSNYVNRETGKPTFTTEEAAQLQAIMNDCIDWCDAHDTDIYEIALLIHEAVSKPVEFNIDTVDLNGPEGNAYWLMGKWKVEATKAGWHAGYIKDVLEEAMEADYENLKSVLKRYTKYC